jgi:hypothetical protein
MHGAGNGLGSAQELESQRKILKKAVEKEKPLRHEGQKETGNSNNGQSRY